MSLTLGIDIGSQGALALLDQAVALLAVADMPILRAVGAFAFGRARGVVEGVLAALGLLTPASQRTAR